MIARKFLAMMSVVRLASYLPFMTCRLAPFQDDSVTDVLGYKVEVLSCIPQSEKDPITRSYTISCLLNDKAYMLRIAALNLYGVGSWKQVRARRVFSITFQSKSSSTPNGGTKLS